MEDSRDAAPAWFWMMALSMTLEEGREWEGGNEGEGLSVVPLV